MTEEEKRKIEEKIRYEELIRDSIAKEKKEKYEHEQEQKNKEVNEKLRQQYIIQTKMRIKKMKRTCALKVGARVCAWYGLLFVIYLIVMTKINSADISVSQQRIEALGVASLISGPVIIMVYIIAISENKMRTIIIMPILAILILYVASFPLGTLLNNPKVYAYLSKFSDTQINSIFFGMYTLMLAFRLFVTITIDRCDIKALERTICEIREV